MAEGLPMIDEQLEADVARERVAATIDELQDRLNPRRMLGDAVGKVQSQGTELVEQARNVMKSHPLAIGAVVLAIGVALLAKSKIATATVDLGDDFRGYTDYDDGLGGDGAAASSYADEDDDSVPPPARAPTPRLASLANRAEVSAHANPIGSILVGLLSGAVLGALFPATARESDLFGETGDRLGRAARAALRGARDEFDAHGVSLDAARRAAAGIGASARSAVTAGSEEFRNRPRPD